MEAGTETVAQCILEQKMQHVRSECSREHGDPQVISPSYGPGYFHMMPNSYWVTVEVSS